MTARVLIDGSSEMVFDYAIPAGLPVVPGCRVRVPLRRQSATGTVLAVGEAVQASRRSVPQPRRGPVGADLKKIRAAWKYILQSAPHQLSWPG